MYIWFMNDIKLEVSTPMIRVEIRLRGKTFTRNGQTRNFPTRTISFECHSFSEIDELQGSEIETIDAKVVYVKEVSCCQSCGKEL